MWWVLLALPALAPAARSRRGAAGSFLGGRYELLGLQGGPLSAGRFEEKGLLGSGAFGEAWRARDRRSGEVVAVKLFRAGSKGVKEYVRGGDRCQREERWRERAERECLVVQRMLAGNSSYPGGRPHLCRCLEAHVRDVEEGEPAYLVEEDCGQSLEQRAAQGPAYSRAEARRWMAEALMGMAFMLGLERPMNHMDLGLRNIAVGGDGHARLIDFGMAEEVISLGKATEGQQWGLDAIRWAVAYSELLRSSQPAGEEEEDRRLQKLARGKETPPRELLRLMHWA